MTFRQATIDADAQRYAGAMEIIQRDYATNLELDDVAKHLASSRRQLQRSFERLGDGLGFRDTLYAVRMREAARLLRNSPHLTIRAVAAQVGYNQPAQFAKAFRLFHGTVPSKYAGSRRAASRAG